MLSIMKQSAGLLYFDEQICWKSFCNPTTGSTNIIASIGCEYPVPCHASIVLSYLHFVLSLARAYMRIRRLMSAFY